MKHLRSVNESQSYSTNKVWTIVTRGDEPYDIYLNQSEAQSKCDSENLETGKMWKSRYTEPYIPKEVMTLSAALDEWMDSRLNSAEQQWDRRNDRYN